MASSAQSADRVLDVAGQRIDKYYDQRNEAPLSGKATSSGITLYRALARQIIGTPSASGDIRDAVQLFFLRLHANNDHPLHSECVRREAEHHQDTGLPLFCGLEVPDLRLDMHVLWMIAHALKVRIDIHVGISTDGQLKAPLCSVGPTQRRVCKLLHRRLRGGGITSSFDSLLPDQSGKALIEYLLEQRQLVKQSPSNAEVKQMSWAWKETQFGTKVSVFNEYDPASKESNLQNGAIADRLDTFVITVNDAKQIGPSMEIFREALRRAPNQCRWTRHSQNREEGFMLTHCSVDAEFVKLPRTEGFRGKAGVDTGVLEELCSVLTFAVGRHFFLVVNVVHLLETADKDTVPNLSMLFRETIFNPGLLKLWWNPQSDIMVLNNTIAHMFQGTKREPYSHHSYRSSARYTISGRFHLHSETKDYNPYNDSSSYYK